MLPPDFAPPALAPSPSARHLALELLAPARDAAIGIEAVEHGADAVYIGGPSFGARQAADNSVADVARLAAHAHRFNARIFATLNTILRDDELEAARQLAWQLYDAGVDALIIQDMGLLEIDLPPIQLHASTQCDIRTVAKARFLQDCGFSQIVLARELTLAQIAEIHTAVQAAQALGAPACTLEFFVHGALCVAYSGQCTISHAHTGRSANRGDCSQACRLPYQVVDAQGRFVAHDQHVLSLKDNNQSANLAALVAAGVRSFKIEGRYKDMGYVKNITAHYRQLLDALIDASAGANAPADPADPANPAPQGRAQPSSPALPLARAASGRCRFRFTPDPAQNFNRAFTDYFVNGRQSDIGAFDSPKNPGQPIGWVSAVAADHFELTCDDPATQLANGDGLCYFDLQKELVGAQTNRVTAVPASPPNGPSQGQPGGIWRIDPKDPMRSLRDLRKGTIIHRNRSIDWVRTLEKKSAQRRIGCWLSLCETATGLQLTATDEDQNSALRHVSIDFIASKDIATYETRLRDSLGKLGDTVFELRGLRIDLPRPWFVPASALNALRRDTLAALEAARAAAFTRLPHARPVEPPAPYPDDTLTYLANVYNHRARDFYARHGVKVIAAAFESHEETGEVSLMVTKHCVRYALSLCPKQAKGITGVQGTVRAEPLQLINGKEKLSLRFDCKACEMHVVGKIKRAVLQAAAAQPMRFYRARPVSAAPQADR